MAKSISVSPEDLGSVPSTHIKRFTTAGLWPQRIMCPLLDSACCVYSAHTHNLFIFFLILALLQSADLCGFKADLYSVFQNMTFSALKRCFVLPCHNSLSDRASVLTFYHPRLALFLNLLMAHLVFSGRVGRVKSSALACHCMNLEYKSDDIWSDGFLPPLWFMPRSERSISVFTSSNPLVVSVMTWKCIQTRELNCPSAQQLSFHYSIIYV